MSMANTKGERQLARKFGTNMGDVGEPKNEGRGKRGDREKNSFFF